MNKTYERITGRIEAVTKKRDDEISKLSADIAEHKAKAEAAKVEADNAVSACDIECYKTHKAAEHDHELNVEMLTKYLERVKDGDIVEPAECEEVAKAITKEQVIIKTEAEKKLKPLLEEVVRVIDNMVAEIEKGNEVIRKWHKEVKAFERINGKKIHAYEAVEAYGDHWEFNAYKERICNSGVYYDIIEDKGQKMPSKN